jgi:hypothetical protein
MALASVTTVAQQPAQKTGGPGQTAASPNQTKPQVPKDFKVTKVDFVPSFKMVNTTVTAQPGQVIVVVQTDSAANGAGTKLDHYAFKYTTAGSKTGSIPALATGGQYTLVDGEKLQTWICVNRGLISGMVDLSQNITGFTVVAALPNDVTSFTLSIQDWGYLSPLIRRDSQKGSPAAK